MARLLVDEGYLRAVNSNPSDRLLEKLQRLGWRPGQLIYSDWKNHELKFFDNKEDLRVFLEKKKNIYQKAVKPGSHLDILADIELQFEEYDKFQ